MDEVILGNGSVPVALVAKIYGKDATWVRSGIILGWLPIGTATKNGTIVTSYEEADSMPGRVSYYISPKKLWEETGYAWKGEKVLYGNNYTCKIIPKEQILDRTTPIL